MLRIVIYGIGGKMGQVVAARAAEQPDISVAAGIDAMVGKMPIQADFPLFTSLKEADVEADVVIDFTRPSALPDLLAYARRTGTALVLATTGYSEADLLEIERAAQDVPLFQAANMSLGINLMARLIFEGATFFGDASDVEIIEKHHRTKVDSPSGTALMLAGVVNEAYLGAKQYKFGRHTKTEGRQCGEIGIHAIRGGTMVGEHSVNFLCDDEVLEIRHSASSRVIYANGALRAARYLAGRQPGLYHMRDLLLENATVTNLYINRDVAMITLNGLSPAAGPARVFALMGELGVNVDMISQTAPVNGKAALSFSLPLGDLPRAAQRFEELDLPCDKADALVKIAVEGLGMERQSGVAARLFSLLEGCGVSPHMVTTSETKIQLLLNQRDEHKTVAALKEAFSV